jgi:membrane protein DedA with SNARE-associated domain
MKNFLFLGTWGYMPKCVFWFLLGLLACSINERGSNDGTQPISWLMVAIGAILAAYSLYISLKAEK